MMRIFRRCLTIGRKDLEELLTSAIEKLKREDKEEVDGLRTELDSSRALMHSIGEDLKYIKNRESVLLDMLSEKTGKNRYVLTQEVSHLIAKQLEQA